MNSLSIIGGSAESKEFLRGALAGIFDSKFVEFSDIGQSTPGLCTLVDVDLNNVRYIPYLKKWLERKPTGAKVVFIADKTSGSQAERAFAIGASDVVYRPIQSADLLAKLLGDVESLSGGPPSKEIRNSPGGTAAVGGLRKLFSSAIGGDRVDFASLHSAGEPLVDELESKGLAAWIRRIRTHHSQTYQHSLMVTGLLVAFGQHLEVSRSDRIRLSMAGSFTTLAKLAYPLPFWKKRGAPHSRRKPRSYGSIRNSVLMLSRTHRNFPPRCWKSLSTITSTSTARDIRMASRPMKYPTLCAW